MLISECILDIANRPGMNRIIPGMEPALVNSFCTNQTKE
jgi:hypothetical protein